MKRFMPLLLCVFCASAGSCLELPGEPWTQVVHRDWNGWLAETGRPEDIRKLVAFFDGHREGWLAGLPPGNPESYVSFFAPQALANFGLTTVDSVQVLSCEGMRLPLSAAESQELAVLLVDRRPVRDPLDVFWDSRGMRSLRQPPPVYIEVWRD
jgi:hypothetical protein